MTDEIFSPTSNHGQGSLVGGVSSAEDGAQLVLRINPITKRLLVDASGAGGVQYENGDVDASPTGNVVMWLNSAGDDALYAVSQAMPLPVTANAGTDLNTSSLALEAGGNLATIAGAIDGSEMQVDIYAGDAAVSSIGFDADDVSPGSGLNAGAFLYGYDQVGGNWDRLTAISSLENDLTPTNILAVASFNYGFDGANFDRQQIVWSEVDDLSSVILLATGAFGYVYDGAGWDRMRGNATNGIQTYNGVTGIGHGIKTVTAAGTDEALAGSTPCKKVIIQAQTDNTGWIAVGASGVDATEATGTGLLLDAGDIVEIDITDLSAIYIDSTVSGDGVRFTYFT